MTEAVKAPRPQSQPKLAIDPLDPAVVLSHGDLAALSKMMKRNVFNRDELLAAIASLNTVNVEGIPIVLEPRLLQRLKSRCLDKPNWPQWLAASVVKQLHDLAGW